MSNLSLFSSLPISALSLCLEAAEAENVSSGEEGVFLNKLFEVYSTIHCSVCVGVTGCVAVTVGSESEDDDNDEEEEDEECLKKLRQKVCMHGYVGLNVYAYGIIMRYLSQVVHFRRIPQYPVESFRDCLRKWMQIGCGHSEYYLHGFQKRL